MNYILIAVITFFISLPIGFIIWEARNKYLNQVRVPAEGYQEVFKQIFDKYKLKLTPQEIEKLFMITKEVISKK